MRRIGEDWRVTIERFCLAAWIIQAGCDSSNCCGKSATECIARGIIGIQDRGECSFIRVSTLNFYNKLQGSCSISVLLVVPNCRVTEVVFVAGRGV